MKIIAVVGTGSGCGKTTVACRILRAIPGLGAVKISPRRGASRVEWGAGEPGKDTDLYAASGAVQIARIIGSRDQVRPTWEMIRGKFAACRGAVIEGASGLSLPEERYVIFVVGDARDELLMEHPKRAMAATSDAIIERSSHLDIESLANSIRTFLGGSPNEQI